MAHIYWATLYMHMVAMVYTNLAALYFCVSENTTLMSSTEFYVSELPFCHILPTKIFEKDILSLLL